MPRRDGEVFRLGTAMGLRPSDLGQSDRPGFGGDGHQSAKYKRRPLAEGPAARKRTRRLVVSQFEAQAIRSPENNPRAEPHGADDVS